ncbi:putative Secreted protein [Nostocoides japonicum T1-X7]|uniref:Putative Secreted protein n=1 Tax=Nostocoides japonicum T1-X7 TaxID=1194083 RepID=A0A077M2C3_9MICO|nr:DUF4350 domain-containing protein [Tetrasphaera japonica]CCH79981.1 putative Secreted protein [Tetrasphaera japonica T1-X7]
MVWAAVVLVAIGVIIAAALLRPVPRGAYDPDSPAPTGAQAMARVLAAHGVDVDVRRSIGSFEDARLDGGTTVLIVQPERLSPENARRAYEAASRAARVVLLAPSQSSLDDLGVPATASIRWSSTPTPARCSSDIVRPTDLVQRGVFAYRPSEGTGAWTRCFTDGDPDGRAGLLVRAGGSGQAELVLVGYRENLTNAYVSQDDNAALFVRALGHSPHLVWYVPGIDDLGEQYAGGIVWPDWFEPLVWMLGSSVVLLCLVRARRLGRLVPEPLPAVVRAVETTENRGRLYRRARERRRTAAVLQAGTRARLAHRFGVRPSEPPEHLVDAVSRATGRVPREIGDLLLGPVADTDTALVTLAQQLSHLEEQVRMP